MPNFYYWHPQLSTQNQLGMQHCKSNGSLKGLKTTSWGEKESVRHSGSSPSHCTHAFRVPKRNTRKNDLSRSLLAETTWKSSGGGLHTTHLQCDWVGCSKTCCWDTPDTCSSSRTWRRWTENSSLGMTHSSQAAPTSLLCVFLFSSSWVGVSGTAQWPALRVAPRL